MFACIAVTSQLRDWYEQSRFRNVCCYRYQQEGSLSKKSWGCETSFRPVTTRVEQNRKLAGMSSTRNTSACTLVAQAQPTLTNNGSSINGNTIPPIEPPFVAIPVAFAHLVRKECAMAATAGLTMRDVPTRMPKTRKYCQDSE